MTQEKIDKLKEKYASELKGYGEEVQDSINSDGVKNYHYLEHKLQMCAYYRGAYDALIDLEKVKV